MYRWTGMELAMDKRIVSSGNLDLNAFLSGLSHDLANPLNAISMNAELLRLLIEKNQTERVREIVERVLTDCTRCSRFLRDLRQFADAAKARPREQLTVQGLVDAAEVLARAGATEKFPEIAVHGGEIALHGDRQSLELALSALLRNAAEAGARQVRVEAAQSGGNVTFSVHDDGSGVAETAAARIGAPFFSSRRQQGHTGLGLALCAYVASAHGGELSIASSPGQTVATLQLPQSPA